MRTADKALRHKQVMLLSRVWRLPQKHAGAAGWEQGPSLRGGSQEDVQCGLALRATARSKWFRPLSCAQKKSALQCRAPGARGFTTAISEEYAHCSVAARPRSKPFPPRATHTWTIALRQGAEGKQRGDPRLSNEECALWRGAQG